MVSGWVDAWMEGGILQIRDHVFFDGEGSYWIPLPLGWGQIGGGVSAQEGGGAGDIHALGVVPLSWPRPHRVCRRGWGPRAPSRGADYVTWDTSSNKRTKWV